MKKKIIIAITIFLIIAIGVIVGIVYNNNKKGKQQQIVQTQIAKIPELEAKYKNQVIGVIDGYTMAMNQQFLRDVIIPIGESQEASLTVKVNENKVEKINYEILSIDDGRLIDGGEITDFSESDGKINFKYKTSTILKPRKEYFIKFSISTDKFNEINYYARTMVVEEEFVTDQIKFAKDFSDKTFNEQEAKKLALYLEPDKNLLNDNIGQTTIRSDYSSLVWSTIVPKKITDTSVTIKEICIKDSGQAATYTMNYQIAATNAEKIEEKYNVAETITVWTCAGKLYVLAYDREVNQIWEANEYNVGNSFIDLGIQNQTEIEFVESKNQQYLSYAINGSLYELDTVNKQITPIYKLNADSSNVLNKTKSKAINVDDKGNVNYMIYGYSPALEHAGKNGISIMRYDNEKKSSIEIVFIPCDNPASILEQQMSKLCYIGDGTLYLMLDKSVYYANLSTKEWGTLISDMEQGSFAVSDDGTILAYNTNGKAKESSSITVVNLTNGEKKTIDAGENQITVCGYTGSNLVYGLGKKDSKVKFFPIYKLVILDKELKEIKTYEQKNVLIKEVEITDTIIHMKRWKNGKNISDDQLLDNTEDTLPIANSSYYLDSVKQRELAIAFTNNLDSSIKLGIVSVAEVSFDATTEMDALFETSESSQYYVYGYGKLQGIYTKSKDAIKAARDVYGLIIDDQGVKTWTIEENYN